MHPKILKRRILPKTQTAQSTFNLTISTVQLVKDNVNGNNNDINISHLSQSLPSGIPIIIEKEISSQPHHLDENDSLIGLYNKHLVK